MLSKAKTNDLLEELSQRGYISTKRDLLVDRHYKFPRKLKKFKLGIISDTHIGSQWQQITLCREAYKIFQEQGVVDVLHGGDITDGTNMRPGHSAELHVHGNDPTTEYIVKNYPVVDGITTHLIGGN